MMLKGKLAKFILELLKEQNLKDGKFTMPFSITTLSLFLGIKRQSASKAFNELLKDKILVKISSNKFQVLDMDELLTYIN